MHDIIFEHNQNNVFIIQVFVMAGSAFESSGEHGLSHLLEHMMFKSKKNLPVEKLLIRLNSLGGVFNAITNKDYTCYYIRTIDRNWIESVNILKTIVLEPYFLQKDLDKERKVVIEEYLQYEDDVKDKAFSIAYNGFLPKDSPYHHSVKGNLNDIRNTDLKKLRKYYDAHYGKIMLYVNCKAGLKNEAKTYIRKVFANQICNFESNVRSFPTAIKIKTGPIIKIIPDTTRSQNASVIMFNGFAHNNNKNLTLSLVWNILVGSLNSLLMLEMREKRGLVYSIASFNDACYNTGFTGIYFSSSANDIQIIISRIFKILKRLCIKGLSKDILTYSKASYINKLEYKLTDLDFRSERSMLRYFYNCKWDETYILRHLRRITNDKIIKVCNEVFNINHLCVVSIGKYTKPEKLEKNIKNVLLKY